MIIDAVHLAVALRHAGAPRAIHADGMNFIKGTSARHYFSARSQIFLIGAYHRHGIDGFQTRLIFGQQI